MGLPYLQKTTPHREKSMRFGLNLAQISRTALLARPARKLMDFFYSLNGLASVGQFAAATRSDLGALLGAS